MYVRTHSKYGRSIDSLGADEVFLALHIRLSITKNSTYCTYTEYREAQNWMNNITDTQQILIHTYIICTSIHVVYIHIRIL